MRWALGWVSAAAVAGLCAGCAQPTVGIATAGSATNTTATITNTTGGVVPTIPTTSAASTGPAPSGGSRITVGPLSVTLPPGVRYLPRTPDGIFDGCLSTADIVCAATIRDLRPLLDGPGSIYNRPDATKPYGWYTGTDVPSCMPKHDPPGSEVRDSVVLRSGLAPVGPKRAEYGRWRVTCADPTQSGEVRMWWLPTSKVLVVEFAGGTGFDAELERMLATATFR